MELDTKNLIALATALGVGGAGGGVIGANWYQEQISTLSTQIAEQRAKIYLEHSEQISAVRVGYQAELQEIREMCKQELSAQRVEAKAQADAARKICLEIIDRQEGLARDRIKSLEIWVDETADECVDRQATSYRALLGHISNYERLSRQLSDCLEGRIP